jgi:hypothetical protein
MPPTSTPATIAPDASVGTGVGLGSGVGVGGTGVDVGALAAAGCEERAGLTNPQPSGIRQSIQTSRT